MGMKPRSRSYQACVARFGTIMVRKLRKNHHKGGWDDCRLRHLTDRMDEERRELDNAISMFLATINTASCSRAEVEQAAADLKGECADIANFCMMISERVNMLGKL